MLVLWLVLLLWLFLLLLLLLVLLLALLHLISVIFFSGAWTNSAFRECEIGIDHCIFEKSFLRVDFLHFEDFLVDRVAVFSVCSPFLFHLTLLFLSWSEIPDAWLLFLFCSFCFYRVHSTFLHNLSRSLFHSFFHLLSLFFLPFLYLAAVLHQLRINIISLSLSLFWSIFQSMCQANFYLRTLCLLPSYSLFFSILFSISLS